jgi:hypothetical protein
VREQEASTSEAVVVGGDVEKKLLMTVDEDGSK